MKKLTRFFTGLLLIPTLFFTSCDRGEDPINNVIGATDSKFTLMKEYMVSNNLDVDKILTNVDGEKFVVAAPSAAGDVDAFLSKYYIMDIRSSNDFLAAHVKGAKNVPFANILTEAAKTSKPILIVCYTGQTACFGTALLRMYGYPKTRALKWGMSGWNQTTAGSWNNEIKGNLAASSSNWTYSQEPPNVTYSDPKITTLLTDGQAILKERVEAVVASGFKGVNGADVLSNPSNYFINNYFSETDYLGFGHINTAYRILPFKLADNSYLSLNPDANTLVTYCYTGQTSAVLTATLRVLGYNGVSLKFGMNSLYNSNPVWVSNKWSASVPKNHPVFQN